MRNLCTKGVMSNLEIQIGFLNQRILSCATNCCRKLLTNNFYILDKKSIKVVEKNFESAPRRLSDILLNYL